MADDESHNHPHVLNDTDASTADVVEMSNPWVSESSTDPDHLTVVKPQVPELSVSQVESPKATASEPSVLTEFDPLACDPVEKNARDAWENAESHPPPPPPPTQDPSNPSSTGSLSPTSPSPALLQDAARSEFPSHQPAPQAIISAPALSSSFPSLASLARTLTLSPRRSVTPPPRTSSLHHERHASLPSVPSDLTTSASLPTANLGETPSQTASADDEQRNSHRPTASSDAVRVTGSPKPDGLFDFQKFLDQMKTKGADPIAKYLRSFLSNFAKKTFAVNDQIKIIHDFLDFISDKMRTMEGSPWQYPTPQDFDNAMEAMEKLVMNRLYEFTFQPLLPPSQRTTDDLERDHVLRQRISLFGWLREEHLDVPIGGEAGQGAKEVNGFLEFAQQELLKINHYKAPRDKLICILNCCKVIFGLIRHAKLPEGADSFIPILIFVILKANPEHLLSNMEYINRFRSPTKLQSEAGYYLSSLMGAVSFIETMDHSSLSNISQEEFERNVEAAIETLPITRTPSPPSNIRLQRPRTPNITGTPIPTPPKLRPSASPLAGEEAARPLSLPMPSSSSDVTANGLSPGHPDSSQVSLAEDTRRFFQRTSDTISKPLAAIGRIFSDVLDESGIAGPQGNKENERRMGWRDLPGPFAPLSVANVEQEGQQPPASHWSHPDQIRQHDATQQAPQTPTGDGSYQPPIQTPYKPRVRPAYSNSPNPYLSSPGTDYTPTTRGQPSTNQPLAMGVLQPYQSPSHPPHALSAQRHLQIATPHPSRNPTPTLDFCALQDEIDRAHLAAQDAARATLMQIFPTVDRDVAEMVLEANDGDLGRSIEGLLEISGGESQAVH